MRMAVIPARGGSKRIPRKNIREFCGRPIIGWSIDAARRSGLFGRVIVSTDDDEIGHIAEQFGAEVPFKRPAELSGDVVGTIDVIAHAARWALDSGLSATTVCCLYPTAPLIQVDDLSTAVANLESGEWDYVLSAAAHPAPIFRAFEAMPGGGLRMFFPEHASTRSQDLPAAWYDAGQFYCGTTAAWLEHRPLFGARSTTIRLPSWRVQDIDTPEDWARAEMIFTLLKDGQR